MDQMILHENWVLDVPWKKANWIKCIFNFHRMFVCIAFLKNLYMCQRKKEKDEEKPCLICLHIFQQMISDTAVKCE